MKIAIISDTHDNLPSFKKAVDIITEEKIGVVLHCGDIAKPQTLKEAIGNFKGKIHIVFGNIDEEYSNNDSFSKIPKVKIHGKIGEIEINDKKIAFLHSPQEAKKLARSQKYDIVFYGHTHKPWEEKIGKTRLVNPGNITGLYFRSTFAIYDTETDKLELKII